MTQQTLLEAGFSRLVGAVNAVHNLHTALAGEAGSLGSLTTTDKTSLVNAINEVDAALASVASIDDGAPTTGAVWSSSKTQAEITTAIAAALEGEDLSDIAAQIAALVSADADLLSVGASQGLSAAQQLQGCQNLDIGDPTYDYVPAINTALNSGL